MLFVQKLNKTDSLGMEFVQRITISDNPRQLIMTNNELIYNDINPIEVDFVNFTKSNKDLILYENKFGIDEVNFTINEAAAVTDNDLLLIAFLQKAANTINSLYIANMIYPSFETNPTYINYVEFIGKINETIKIKELFWEGHSGYRNEYSSNIAPLRQFEFSALSIDVALLDICVLSGSIYSRENELVPNIMDRIRADGWALFKPLFKLTYTSKGRAKGILINPFWAYLVHQHEAPLYDVLQTLLRYGELIIFEKSGVRIKFNLMPSYLGYDVCPAVYNYTNNTDYINVQNVFADGAILAETEFRESQKKPFWFDSNDPQFEKYIPHIEMDKLSVTFKYEVAAQNTGKELSEIYEQLSTFDLANKKKTILESKNLSEILFESVRAFNCFIDKSIRIDDDGVFNVDIRFLPRTEFSDADMLTIADVVDSSIDISTVISDLSTNVFANSTHLSIDGEDIINAPIIPRYTDIKPDDIEHTQKYELNNKERDYLEKQKKAEFKELLYSFSQTLRQSQYQYRPLNARFVPEWDFAAISDLENGVFPSGLNTFYWHTIPTNTIYIHNVDSVNGYIDVYSLPAGYIFTKIDGVPLKFNSLSEFINYSAERQTTFYRSERSLTIPSITGFKIGSNYATIQEIRCGQKIQINQKIPVETNGALSYGIETKNFVIVGIERNYESNETTLKLQNDSFFSYGENTETYTNTTILIQTLGGFNPIEIDNIEYSGTAGNDLTRLQPIYYYSNITDFEDINTLINANAWECIPALAHSDYANYNIGIATIDAANGDVVSFQTAGRISDSSFNFDLNKPVYLRNSGISQNCLLPAGSGTTENQANENENMIIEIGLPDTIFSFVLHQNPIKFVYDTELLNTE